MWKQSAASITTPPSDNPAGCLNDLYPFVRHHLAGDSDHGGGQLDDLLTTAGGGRSALKKDGGRVHDQRKLSSARHGRYGNSRTVSPRHRRTTSRSDGSGKSGDAAASRYRQSQPDIGTTNQLHADGQFKQFVPMCFTAPGLFAIVRYLEFANLSAAPNAGR